MVCEVLRCTGSRNPDSNYHTYQLSLGEPRFLAHHVVCRSHRQVGVYREQNLSSSDCFLLVYNNCLCTFSYDFIRKTSRKLRTSLTPQRAWVRQESYREWREVDARAKLWIWLLEKKKPQRRGLLGLHRVPVWDQSHR